MPLKAMNTIVKRLLCILIILSGSFIEGVAFGVPIGPIVNTILLFLGIAVFIGGIVALVKWGMK